MNITLRQITAGVLLSLFINIPVLVITFYVFPFQSWSDLWQVDLFDIPYLLVVVMVVITAGIIGGCLYGVFWIGKIQIIDRQLDQLLKGEKLTSDGLEQVFELHSVLDHLQQLQMKLMKQTELSQRLASERAEEREKSLQEVVVQERNRLARELHDSVSQQLFAASMMISAINASHGVEGPIANKQLAMVEKMIHQSQLEMRALLLHLRPAALKGKTLQEGMEELLTELIQKAPIKVEWKIEAFELDKGVEDHLFRILQEAVSNTLRHAKANELHVMLIKRDDFIIMRVTDDGVGFDINDSTKMNSYGLQNMRERAMEIGGQFRMVSLENQGTQLEVKVPFMKREVGFDD